MDDLITWTEQEYRIFKQNNSRDRTISDFFEFIPLGVIYKNAILPKNTDLNKLITHYKLNPRIVVYLFIELTTFEEFKLRFDYLMTLNHDYYVDDDAFRYNDYICQASIRGREDIVEYLYNNCKIIRDMSNPYEYMYYPASKKLRDLFVSHESVVMEYIMEERPIKLDIADKFGLLAPDDLDGRNFLIVTLWLTTCYQEQDVFRKYYLEYENSIPPNIERVLQNKSLKYMVDRFNPVFDEFMVE